MNRSPLANLLTDTAAIRPLDAGQTPPPFAQAQTEGGGSVRAAVIDMVIAVVFIREDRENTAREALPALIRADPELHAMLADMNASSYINLGALLGDQGLALRLLALGSHLGFWGLLTPRAIFGDPVDDAMNRKMVGRGFLTTDGRMGL